jgi:regulator of protease activity HflC (stomatin/prohibitin superfamily)
LIIWLLTSLVIVGPDKEAIFSRFGAVVDKKAYGPGLYFKLPWPFTSAQIYDSYKIRILNIGFEPDPDQRHIIWTKAHALKYFDLVVGDGVEIIAIDCQIMFRIKNLHNYLFNMQNSDEFISSTAYKLLTQETVSAKFDDIITRDRRLLADQLKSQLQVAVDQENLGINIIEVVFLAMHPPLEVADAFEDVISAQIDKFTYEFRANTENSYKLSMNQALASGNVMEAEGYAAEHVAKAFGESSAFVSRSLGYQIDADLTRFRLRYECFQKILADKAIYVMDKSLMRKDDRIFLDIRSQDGY